MMAVLSGVIRPNGYGGIVNPSITTELNSYAWDYWPAYATDQLPTIRGAVVNNLPVTTVPRSLSGRIPEQFKADFYNRIHFTPEVMNFGNIIEQQSRQLYIWNAWLTPSVITGQTSTDGLIYIDVEPRTLQPLEELLSACVALPGGVNNLVDDQINLQLLGLPDAVLPVNGTRVAVLPYQPRTQWQEVHEWLTNVIMSYDGSEQRIKVRAYPKVSIDAEYPIPSTEIRRANNIVYGWVRGAWVVALWTDAVRASPVVSGASSLTLSETGTVLDVADEILIWERPDLYEIAQVSSLVSTTLTTVNPVANSYSRPIVLPVVSAVTNAGIVRNTDGFSSDVKTTYRVTKPLQIEGDVPDQYLGNDIYYDEQILPNNGKVSEDMLTRFDEVTNRIATSRYITPWANTKQSRIYTVYNTTKSETYNFKKWLSRRSGKFRPFWTPSFEADFILTSTGPLTDSFTFVENGYSLYANARAHVAVRLKNGDWLPREINSYTDNGDGTTTVTLTSSLAIDAADVDIVCYLGLKRLDTDRVEIYFPGNGKSFASLRIVEISP